MVMTKDEAYKTLNLQSTATEADIKKAFRTLAAKTHPDQNQDNKESSEVAFKKINEAHQILTGKIKSADEMQQQQVANPFDIEDQMRDIFNMNFGGGNNRQQPFVSEQIDLNQIQIQETFEEAILGNPSKNIKYNIKEYCVQCERSGISKISKQTCVHCKGSGIIFQRFTNGMFVQMMQSPCAACQGRGYSGKPCTSCNGQTFVLKKMSLNVNLPPVGSAGIKINISKQGHKYKDKAGDTLLHVTAKETENTTSDKYKGYYIDGINVKSSIDVGLDVLLFGGKISIETVGGDIVEENITPLTKPGHELIIKGKGVRDASRKIYGYDGSHIITLGVKYPDKEFLTKDVENSFKKLYNPGYIFDITK